MNNLENKYILYVGQEANFQSRSMLIPAKLFIEARPEWYEILKKHTIKNVKFGEIQIDNLLVVNYIFDNGIGVLEKTEYSEICQMLTHYADGLDDDCYLNMIDKKWYDLAQCNLCGGFNHSKNYQTIKDKCHQNNIVLLDSFLVLESDDHKLNISPVETVNELFETYYLNVK